MYYNIILYKEFEDKLDLRRKITSRCLVKVLQNYDLSEELIVELSNHPERWLYNLKDNPESESYTIERAKWVWVVK